MKQNILRKNAYCFPIIARPFMKTDYILKQLEKRAEYILKLMMRCYDPAGFKSTLYYISANRL